MVDNSPSMRLYLSMLAIFIFGIARAQSPGSVHTPALLPNPMDPNSDGWITSTGVAFTGPLDEAEFELPFIPIPEYQPEPVPDNQVPSTSCTMYELVGDAANGAESTYYYYQDLDGIPDTGDELVFFRFRVARIRTNSVGLSILIDTDHKFGFIGPELDPNAVVGNPGFELEISVTTGSNGQIRVFNVDGVSSPGVATYTYSVDTNLQIAYALNQGAACSHLPSGFIDIYLPFSALNISPSAQIRMVGASGELTGSLLGGKASDISGVDGNAIPGDDDQFIAVIGNYPPFSFQEVTNTAPVALDASKALNENASNGTAVHSVSASDPDGDILTYTITGGNTSSAFAINASGQITVSNAAALNYETTPSFALTVRVSDGTLFDDAAITINLNNVNESPSAIDATASVNENAANGTAVHTVSASDPDDDVLSYTITGGNTSSAFAINSSGQITVSNATALNYETTPSFSVTVRVSDGTLFDDAAITINLNNVNESPSASDATASVNENSVNGSAVHTVSASDPDGDVLTYVITGGNTSSAFAINSSGQITVSNAAALNYETTPSFNLTVRVSDGTLFDDVAITINLNNINETPSASDATASVNENAANGTAVHSVSASDPDGDVLTYTITGGNTSSAFAINSSGQITVSNATALNYETTPSFSVTVRVSDGALFDDAVITINLNNVNETPFASDATASVNENAANGTPVHTVSASDPDGNGLTYAITGGNTSSAFAINNSGQITVSNAAALDYETTPSFSLTVRVSDGTLFDDATITININNTNETPSASDATASVNENAANGTAVHTVSASDPDGNGLTYTITGGNTPSAFAINNSGQITVSNAAALNYETTPSFNVTVRVSDGALFDDAAITINLNNVNESPSASDATASVNENSANGTAVHTVSASDPDGNGLTYAITGGNTSSAFAINSSGQITVSNAAALNYETTPSFSLTVRVSDGTLFDDVAITINLNNINETPSASDATASVNENAANGTAVHTVSASDPDGDALTYAITGGNTFSAFAINSSGQITVSNAAALNYETTPSFNVTVRASDGTLFDDAAITINLNNVNESPSASDATASVNENAANGTAVHTVSASDPDGDALDYTITAGNTGGAFAINSSGQIIISNAPALDFETKPSFALTVRVSDGILNDDVAIDINLNDVNESVSAIDATQALKENSPVGTLVHTVSVSNTGGNVLTYTITSGNINSAFAVNSAGQITVNNAAALDFETMASFSLMIRVSDETMFDDAVVTINLIDVNEIPSANGATVSINENSVNGTTVHTVAASDPEGDILTYAITAGNPNNEFSVSNDGVIAVSASAQLDFETSPTFALTIMVSDGEHFTEVPVVIGLRNINESPRISDASKRIPADLPKGTVVHQVVSDDPDAGDTRVFTIEAGNSDSAFEINEGTGEILVNNIEDAGTMPNPVIEMTVMVKDAGGLSATANITIEIKKIDEQIVVNPLKGFSPDGDGINDLWLIQGIEAFPDNEVKVFNRWGNLVFNTRNYDNQNIAWRGESNGRGSATETNTPETTYFYVITINGFQALTGYVIMKQ